MLRAIAQELLKFTYSFTFTALEVSVVMYHWAAIFHRIISVLLMQLEFIPMKYVCMTLVH